MTNKIGFYGLLIFFHLNYTAIGQTISKKILEIKSKEVVQVSVDRLGNFFIVSTGLVKKIDANGKVTASLKQKNITILEPWYHPAIFIYDQKKNSCLYFDRNFENEKEIKVNSAWAIEPSLACPSNDNKIWLFDQADASVKKVNPLTNEVLIEFILDTTQFKTAPSFTFLREYQSMIFLLDKYSGILVLNSIGKQIKKIDKNGISNFGFFGEYLYYLDDPAIKFLHLVTEEAFEVKVEGNNKFALVSDERILLVNQKNKLSIFEFRPE
jgi:hypothetical protein